MSQIKASKRFSNPKIDCAPPKNQLSEIQNILNTLLKPIIHEISVLNEMVRSLLTTINKKEVNEVEKITKNCEFASSSIATDVTMMASSMHRLTKNYESMKEQVIENQKNIDKFCGKLNSVEKLLTTFLKIENNRATKQLEEQILEKVSNLEQILLGESDFKQGSESSQLSENPKQADVNTSIALDSSLQLLTLNNEEDFPNGSWLGDFASTKYRVRCAIPEEDLIYVNTTCATPEKMALTLLDYLFTRETLAVSNISGKSKLGKKKLDPIMIYGIKCHLMYHFNISDKQWERIKLKMDSKCRSAWKKRKLSEPLQLHQEKSLSEAPEEKPGKEDSNMIETIEQVMVGGLKAQVIHTLQGNIEVLQTTKDQILIHNFQNGDYILPTFCQLSNLCTLETVTRGAIRENRSENYQVMDIDTEDSSTTVPLSTAGSDGKEECEENLTIITTDDSDLHATDTVSFVTEPMLEVFTEEDALKIGSSVLIEEG